MILSACSQRQADVVQAVEQAVAAERLDLERQRQAVVVGERARFEVGRQLVAGMLGRALEQVVDLLFAEPDRQHAVLEAVVVEDVGEAGGDDHAEAVVLERPRGVLAARAAAEVAPRQQNARALGLGLVQLEVGIRPSRRRLRAQSQNRNSPKPVRSIRLRNCLGMI